ncbi:MAG: 7-carboxy-7-deazaguanine synthase QueE [Candidatus Aminicenantes bacterium]|nr:7-carboxy-7-deazaguanine synthase QueE [Candidatus Aminicenantes bacterium]
MRLPPTLKIKEIFFSAEGEGLRQGEPTIFVRFAGCNLRCSFCDTKYAWTGGQPMSSPEILSKIVGISEHLPTRWVVLTGGEPLCQNLKPLVRELKKAGYLLHLETNGTRPLNFKVDWLTISPKPPAYKISPDLPSRAREVKLVVTRDLDLKIIKKMRKLFGEKIPLILQPQSAASWSYRKAWKLYLEAVKTRVPNIRLSCQLHKVYGIK